MASLSYIGALREHFQHWTDYPPTPLLTVARMFLAGGLLLAYSYFRNPIQQFTFSKQE
ncbi:hypothetical protein [Candidatus Protochlamydia naegleriophila]|uniref:hypothetical protein n=1 Tax=Candidatus Protochlamydia naegleriophila TaxID=389348 RepID=UPI000B01721C|nr:hypothetical protein [Candidatus Protochlamydia naegleriophila]